MGVRQVARKVIYLVYEKKELKLLLLKAPKIKALQGFVLVNDYMDISESDFKVERWDLVGSEYKQIKTIGRLRLS